MGCGSSKQALPPKFRGDSDANARETIAAFGDVTPRTMSTRQLDSSTVIAQREQRLMELSNPSPHHGALSSSSAKRMSRVSMKTRGQMVHKVQKAAEKNSVGANGRAAGSSAHPAIFLNERLRRFGMSVAIMEGDGNCQFRAFADQIFGHQKHHALVRQSAVEHMRRNADFYGMYFEGLDGLSSYCKEMSRARTWGDELTLRAVVEAYQVVAHLITSEAENWYLVYQPEPIKLNSVDDNRICRVPPGEPLPRVGKEVFLSYIAPIHYNAIVSKGRPTSLQEPSQG